MEYDVEYLAEGGVYNAMKMDADKIEDLIDNIILKENRVIGRIFLRPTVLNEKRNFQLLHSDRIY
jgi:hypothetical protein